MSLVDFLTQVVHNPMLMVSSILIFGGYFG